MIDCLQVVGGLSAGRGRRQKEPGEDLSSPWPHLRGRAVPRTLQPQDGKVPMLKDLSTVEAGNGIST